MNSANQNSFISNKIDPQIIVIFGSNGDLCKRKLMPALFELYVDNLLPQEFAVLGIGSKAVDDMSFRDSVDEMLRKSKKISNSLMEEKAAAFIQKTYYQRVNNQQKDDFELLKQRLNGLADTLQIPHNYIYYYSIPPFLYDTVSTNLYAYGLTKEAHGWKRVIVEKPFGYSYQTALDLDSKLHQAYKEAQIFRIDHYLGKETVQNITVTRFANSFFEPLWNRKYIEKVEIISAEDIGVGSRGGYYDTSGAIRDMIQNHLLQLLAVVAMEPPVNFDPESIHEEKAKVFRALRPIATQEVKNYVVRGQYQETVVNGEIIKGYLQEEGVPENSKTETFCALKLFIDNWRWSDVPFYLSTGKQLPERVTEVVLHLKPAPLQLFKQRCLEKSANMIILRIQPNESVSICFGMKKPGGGYKVQNVLMNFNYANLSESKIPEAYERLLLDCMLGDSTLYPRTDALMLSWKFIDPILDAFKNEVDLPLYLYDCGSWGPVAAEALYGNKLVKWSPIFKPKNDDAS